MTDSAQPDHWRADAYAASARFVADLAASLVDDLDPQPNERILDIGCGDGAMTERIVARGAQVVAIDASADMVRGAQARGLDARLIRAEALPFEAEFDAVFSNAALHWVTEQQAALDGAVRALKPGGRFVAEMGGQGNVAAIRTALIAALESEAGVRTDLSEIWCFPTVAAQTERLARAGAVEIAARLFARPTPFPSDMETWLETLAAPALARAPEGARAAVRARAAELATPALRADDGTYIGDYVRLRFSARKPG